MGRHIDMGNDRQMGRYLDSCINIWDGLTYGKIESYIYRQTCGQMDVDGQIDGSMERQMDTQIDGQMMDRQINRQIERLIDIPQMLGEMCGIDRQVDTCRDRKLDGQIDRWRDRGIYRLMDR